MQIEGARLSPSQSPHRWAVALACATFPLLWVGGLVTTTDAGMAVPDWPSTYGYNLFLYPWQTWLAGPWDIFVEHGHRLLGAVVGMITIAVVASMWRSDQRTWIRFLGLLALGLVIFQGVLGGMRVRMNEQTLAMLHGCTGPLFFATSIALAVFTSSRWRSGAADFDSVSMPVQHTKVCLLAVVTCVLVYLQILLGAVVRHVPVATEPTTFIVAVRFHLFLAAVLSLHIPALVWCVQRHARHIQPLGGLSWLLMTLLVLQLALGAGTWIIKFAAPSWAPDWVAANASAVPEGGWLQTHVITAHVAVGSLMFSTALALALYSARLLGFESMTRRLATPKLEAAR